MGEELTAERGGRGELQQPFVAPRFLGVHCPLAVGWTSLLSPDGGPIIPRPNPAPNLDPQGLLSAVARGFGFGCQPDGRVKQWSNKGRRVRGARFGTREKQLRRFDRSYGRQTVGIKRPTVWRR
jgi:hypothetical protein